MSFLTPLYILGLAAVSLPILFHLIRRTPQGVQPFSSLMFIVPTPPRLTRRSRLDQILLLLLRAAILGLLAFAFARPFLRRSATTDLSDVSNRVFAVLIDTSGSMRRQGIWQQVESEVDNLLQQLGPHDSIALYRFGALTERISEFEEAQLLPLAGRRALINRQFQQLTPGWGESSLADAMILAADDLDALGDSHPRATLRQLLVISDLQQGCHMDALLGYQWPQSVTVVFRPVESSVPGNASLSVLGTPAEDDDNRAVRVRVSNSRDARQQQFEIGWADAADTSLGPRVGVSVPAGETRVARVPHLAADATPTHLKLTGDAHDFDNIYYVAPATPTTGSIIYCGPESDDDPDQMLYYVKRAVTNDQWHPVDIVSASQPAISALETGRPLMVIITAAVEPPLLAAVKYYLHNGGTGLFVLTASQDLSTAEDLADTKLGTAVATTPHDYALWSEIDFNHRLFRPFAGPLFSDFSKIHFWNYHQLRLPENTRCNTIVRYDNGDAALVEVPVGTGALYVLTSTWRPTDNQLARSSKFVPLLLRFMRTDSPLKTTGYEIGERIVCPQSVSDDGITITKPDGTIVPLATDSTEFATTDQPGLYHIEVGDVKQSVAVNIARAETQTAPLDIAELEQRGVQLGKGSTYAEELASLRQMRDVELEARQGVWHWLLATALLLLVVETVLANRWSARTGPRGDGSESLGHEAIEA